MRTTRISRADTRVDADADRTAPFHMASDDDGDLFETIGSFFVDNYLNYLYRSAYKRTESGEHANKSITELYKQTVTQFCIAVAREPKRCFDFVNAMFTFCKNNRSGTPILVFREFEDEVLQQFIPIEYYQDFTPKERSATLSNIVSRTANELGAVILAPAMLRKVIDERVSELTIATLQDKAVEILISRRDEYFEKFTQAADINPIRRAGKQIRRLEKALAAETSKRKAAEKELNKLKSEIKRCNTVVTRPATNINVASTDKLPELPARKTQRDMGLILPQVKLINDDDSDTTSSSETELQPSEIVQDAIAKTTSPAPLSRDFMLATDDMTDEPQNNSSTLPHAKSTTNIYTTNRIEDSDSLEDYDDIGVIL